jgi:cation transport ATPase
VFLFPQAEQEKKELKRKIQQLENNTQNHEDKQTEINKLKEKLKEKTVIAEQAQSKLEETKTQRDESQDKELENAISKISNSNKDGSNTLKTYKKNSTFLMWSGIGLFALAMLIAVYIYYSKIFSVDISNLSSFHLVLFSPSFVLALIFPLIYLFQFAYLRDFECYFLIVVFFSLILSSLVRLVLFFVVVALLTYKKKLNILDVVWYWFVCIGNANSSVYLL